MKHLNFFSKSSSRSMGHRVTTLALTVGSPSAHRRGAMLRLISVLVLVLTFGVGNAWGAVQSGWARVTNVSQVKSGGTFVIGYEATANSNIIVPLRSNGAEATTAGNGKLYSGNGSGTTSNNGTIDMSNATTTNYEVTIVAGYASDYIAIRMASGNYIGNSGSKNTAKLYTTVSANSSYTPTMGNNNVITLTSPTSVSTTYTTLQYNSNKDQYRYCNYGGTQKNVVMYKKLCTISFDANGGSVSPSSRTQTSADVAITLPTPTRPNYTCTGWFTAKTGGTKRGNAGGSYTPTASETLYAQWEAATPSCTVKPTVGTNLTSVSATANSITATIPISSIGGCNIIENGLVYSSSVATPTIGAANCTKVTTTACGSTAANKTVTITGLDCGTTYYIRGYAENEAGIQYTDVLTQSTSACPKYTVTYNAGTGSCETQYWTQTEANESTTLPTASTNCKGWTFAGWCTSAAGSSETNTTSPGDILTGSYKPTSNITLYAVYTKSEGSPESWNQITDASNVTGGTYVIVASTSTLTGYLPNTGTASAAPTYVTTGLTISNGKITSTVTDGMKWTFSTGTWDDTEEYMYDITITNQDETPKVLNNYANANNGVRVDDNSGTWTIGNHESGTSDVLYLWSNGRYCGVYNNAEWRSYTTYNATNYTADAGSSMIKLFKRTGGSVTYYMSSLDCCTELGSINGSFFWTTHFCPAWPAKHRS